MILRGKKISGPEALQIGLVQEVWPLAEIKDRAIKLAEDLTAQPMQSVKGMLDNNVGCEDKSLQEMLQDERRAAVNILSTPDSRTGMAAFMESETFLPPPYSSQSLSEAPLVPPFY